MQKILCSAYLNQFLKFNFFRSNLVSSCFRLIMLYPHEKQLNSYSYEEEYFESNVCNVWRIF